MPLAPGITNIAEQANKEILRNYEGSVITGGIIPAGTAALVPGQVLGVITASGKWTIYAAGNADGSQVARGIAGNFTTLNATQDQQIHIFLRGNFKLDQLVGLDANAVTNLGGRQDATDNLFAN